MGRLNEDLSGMLPAPGRPMEERHLEACLDFLAHLMSENGEVYAPIFVRLEMELAAVQRRRGPIDRARLRLAAHTIDGGVKAIPSRP